MIPRTLSLSVLVMILALPAGAQDKGGGFSGSLWEGFDWKTVASNSHRALGYITPTLGLATYLSGGDDAGRGHQLVGTTAAWAAGINLVLGLVSHWDRVDVFTDPELLFTRDTLHAVVSATGAGFMVAAKLKGGHDGHDFFGEAGTFLMGSAILLEW